MLALTLTPRDGVYDTDVQRRTAYRELLARVRQVRGVEAAGGTLLLPFEHGVVGIDGGVVLEGEPLDGPSPSWRRIAEPTRGSRVPTSSSLRMCGFRPWAAALPIPFPFVKLGESC